MSQAEIPCRSLNHLAPSIFVHETLISWPPATSKHPAQIRDLTRSCRHSLLFLRAFGGQLQTPPLAPRLHDACDQMLESPCGPLPFQCAVIDPITMPPAATTNLCYSTSVIERGAHRLRQRQRKMSRAMATTDLRQQDREKELPLMSTPTTCPPSSRLTQLTNLNHPIHQSTTAQHPSLPSLTTIVHPYYHQIFLIPPRPHQHCRMIWLAFRCLDIPFGAGWVVLLPPHQSRPMWNHKVTYT